VFVIDPHQRAEVALNRALAIVYAYVEANDKVQTTHLAAVRQM